MERVVDYGGPINTDQLVPNLQSVVPLSYSTLNKRVHQDYPVPRVVGVLGECEGEGVRG